MSHEETKRIKTNTMWYNSLVVGSPIIGGLTVGKGLADIFTNNKPYQGFKQVGVGMGIIAVGVGLIQYKVIADHLSHVNEYD